MKKIILIIPLLVFIFFACDNATSNPDDNYDDDNTTDDSYDDDTTDEPVIAGLNNDAIDNTIWKYINPVTDYVTTYFFNANNTGSLISVYQSNSVSHSFSYVYDDSTKSGIITYDENFPDDSFTVSNDYSSMNISGGDYVKQ